MRACIFVLLKSSSFRCFQLFESTYACAYSLVMYNGLDLVPRRRIACLANETRSNRNRFFATDFFWMKEDRDMEANDLVNDELSSTWQLDRRDATRSDVITWRKVRNAERQVCARQWRCTLNEASHLTTLVGESSIKDR